MRPASKPPLDDNTVAEFLANNGDFLVRRPELLPDIPAQHDSGSGAVVSLAERQVAALRKRNLALRDRLATLLEVARDNDRTFARMRELTLGLMDAANAIELNRLLARHLLAEFHADHAICFVRRSPSEDLAHLVARVAKAPWDRVFDHAAPTCGAYRAEEYALLFPAANLAARALRQWCRCIASVRLWPSAARIPPASRLTPAHSSSPSWATCWSAR